MSHLKIEYQSFVQGSNRYKQNLDKLRLTIRTHLTTLSLSSTKKDSLNKQDFPPKHAKFNCDLG